MKGAKNMTEKEIIKELSKEYNKKEKLIEIIFAISKEMNYNNYTCKRMIEEFFKYKRN